MKTAAHTERFKPSPAEHRGEFPPLPRHRVLGAAPIAIASLLISLPLLCGQVGPAFRHDRDLFMRSWAGSPMPDWHGRLLVGLHEFSSRDPIVDTMDGSGRTESISFQLPESPWITVLAVGAGSDRSVLSGIATGADSRGTGFIAWISPDRTHRTVIRTDRYFAEVVTVAPDGAIWAAGAEADTDLRWSAYNRFRRYDVGGKQLNSFVVADAKSRVAGHPDAAMTSKLMPTPDRVGWFTGGCQYIEFSLTGKETSRFDGPPGLDRERNFAGVALSEDNQLIIGIRGEPSPQLLALERPSRAWVTVSLPGPMSSTWNHVMGFDGAALITMSASDTFRRFLPQTAR